VIVGTARVSSKEQAENSNALKQQIDQLERAGCEKIYVDIESGRWRRKGLSSWTKLIVYLKIK
jgi:DNA invertase Pin-like site-specific DNA recombinase